MSVKVAKTGKYNVMGGVREVDPDDDRYARSFIDSGPCWTPQREAEMELRMREADAILGKSVFDTPVLDLDPVEVEVEIDDEDWTEMEPTEAQLKECEVEFA